MIHRYTLEPQTAADGTTYRSIEVCQHLPRKRDAKGRPIPRMVIRRCDEHGNLLQRTRLSKKARRALRQQGLPTSKWSLA